MEPQRLHCSEMINVVDSEHEIPRNFLSQSTKEGEYAWYLQSNEVARGTSVFSGEMVRRYTIVWGSKSNPRWVGNGGTGSGEGFVDSLQEGDWILVWARAKVGRLNIGRSDDSSANLKGRDEDGRIIFMVSESLFVQRSNPTVSRHFMETPRRRHGTAGMPIGRVCGTSKHRKHD
jgi:hypothetical protein